MKVPITKGLIRRMSLEGFLVQWWMKTENTVWPEVLTTRLIYDLEHKSAITAWNRSWPKNKRSTQAKRQRGKMLFCTRKPPKTEHSLNESTHYQRAHKKNVIRRFFSTVVNENRKYCLARMIDDKAYIRPGTSEGFEKVRNKRILVPVAEDKMWKLPKYDWPEKKYMWHHQHIDCSQKRQWLLTE